MLQYNIIPSRGDIGEECGESWQKCDKMKTKCGIYFTLHTVTVGTVRTICKDEKMKPFKYRAVNDKYII